MVSAQILVTAPIRRLEVDVGGEDRRPQGLRQGAEPRPGVIQAAKGRADRITEASDLWEMEGWLAEQRERIRPYVRFPLLCLPRVFATLLRDCRLGEDDLHGFAQEKLDTIHHLVPT
jgi:hypothetical protein